MPQRPDMTRPTRIRLLVGDKPGTIKVCEYWFALRQVVLGRAVLVDPETPETPETPNRGGGTNPSPETRKRPGPPRARKSD